jgi:hypothetical protein
MNDPWSERLMNMTEEVTAPEIDHRPSATRVTRWGIGITVAWLVILVALIIWKAGAVPKLGLNEWGDFLSGAAAPLALLWLVLGYFQQGIELRQNTAALQLQYEELKRQVSETAELAKNSARQAEAAEGLVSVTGESVRQAAEQAEASYRPIFTLHGTNSGVDGRSMILANVGATVTQISVGAFETGGHVEMAGISNWETRGQHELRFRPDSKFPVVIKFDFTNGLQNRRSIYYLISKFGRFEAIDDKDVERRLIEISTG